MNMGALIAIPVVVTKRWLAQSLAEMGTFEAAIAAGRQAVHAAETRDHPYSLANACNALGIVMLRRGRFAEAMSLLERTVEVSREFGCRELMGPVQPLIANAYAGAGRRADACATLDASRESLSPAPNYQARIGEAALAAGALPQARRHAEAALEFSRRQTARGEEAWSLYLIGEINTAKGQGRWRLQKITTAKASCWPRFSTCVHSSLTATLAWASSTG